MSTPPPPPGGDSCHVDSCLLLSFNRVRFLNCSRLELNDVSLQIVIYLISAFKNLDRFVRIELMNCFYRFKFSNEIIVLFVADDRDVLNVRYRSEGSKI